MGAFAFRMLEVLNATERMMLNEVEQRKQHLQHRIQCLKLYTMGAMIPVIAIGYFALVSIIFSFRSD